MISLHSSSSPLPNTVMPAHMVGPGPVPSMSLNLDEKKAQKKADKKRIKEKRYTLLFLSLSIIALSVYSTLFFYPHLMTYLRAPAELERMEGALLEKEESLAMLQGEKGLHQAAYHEENQRKKTILEAVFPPYIKLKIIQDIENASNTLKSLGTFEMSSIKVDPPVHESLAWVTLVSGSFRASQTVFEAFINDYVGQSGNLEGAPSSIIKAFRQLSIRPMEIKSVQAQSNQALSEAGFNVSFTLAFYTQPGK